MNGEEMLDWMPDENLRCQSLAVNALLHVKAGGVAALIISNKE